MYLSDVYSFIYSCQETTKKGKHWKNRLKYFDVFSGEN